MKTTSLETPSLYGDHHVTEVRRILFEIPGIQDVYASSAFHVIEVTYDEGKVNETEIVEVLKKAGYFGELALPVEMGARSAGEEGERPFFRHTTVYETTQQVVSFAQRIAYSGRPLWPCPGMGVIDKKMEE